MKLLVTLLFLLSSSMVFAEKKMEAKDLSVLGRIDEETYKKVEDNKAVGPEVTAPVANKDSRISMSCKDTMGKEYKKGDSGYETCLMNLKTQHDMNYGKKDNKDGNSANFNFKVGN